MMDAWPLSLEPETLCLFRLLEKMAIVGGGSLPSRPWQEYAQTYEVQYAQRKLKGLPQRALGYRLTTGDPRDELRAYGYDQQRRQPCGHTAGLEHAASVNLLQ